jgi:hypothetical protein
LYTPTWFLSQVQGRKIFFYASMCAFVQFQLAQVCVKVLQVFTTVLLQSVVVVVAAAADGNADAVDAAAARE